MDTDKVKIPYTDLKYQINKFIKTRWQQRWNNNTIKRFLIKPTIGEWKPTFKKFIKDKQVIIVLD